ncbi:MAG: sulfite exporter TauE/SafE family protein [Nitrosomonas sp.]|nr:sulfite exporter TauE/SafE family protein [Nitrosomonas sp.]
MEAWWIFLLTGAVVGFLAGLLGVGGGLLMVPLLMTVFVSKEFAADQVMHLALGTTTAIITLTSLSSLRAHHVRGAVNWSIVRHLTPGIFLGALVGTTLAGQLSSQTLGIIFVIFIYCAATQMWLNLHTRADFSLPGSLGMLIAGSMIGAISSLVAIGGGVLTVPFLTACQIRLHQAIGTAAAVGFPIALASAVGYAANGLLQSQPLPEYAVGYIYLPAFVMVALTGMLTAPLGARAAHAMPTNRLKNIFVGLLYLLGTKLLLEFWR